MSKIKIQIPTQQSFTYEHFFTCNQLSKLNTLLSNGGKAQIAGKYFEVMYNALHVYKSSGYSGSNYAMDLNIAQQEVNLKIKEFC